MKFHFLSSVNPDAKEAKRKLISMYGQNTAENSDYIIPIGGDGLLLKSLLLFFLEKFCSKIFDFSDSSLILGLVTILI